MTPARFEILVETYGADWRHWPEAERPAARAFVEASPQEVQAILEEAQWLDGLLDGAPRPAVSLDLRDRVIADAVKATARRGLGLGAGWRDHLKLALGAGWAAATCAGVVAGVMLSSQLTADLQADTVLYQATLDGADDLEILG